MRRRPSTARACRAPRSRQVLRSDTWRVSPVLADRWANCEECQATEGWARPRWLSSRPERVAIEGNSVGRRKCSPRGHRLFAAVIVETTLGLAAEPAGLDVFHQQRTGPVFGIGKPVVQHLHDGEAGIEPDEVGELQWPHRMMGTEPHRGVNRLDI